MKKLFLLAAVLSTATFLASCSDGGGGGGTQVAAVDARVAVAGDNGRKLFTALVGESFTFTTGVPAFGTAASTTVSITPPSAAGRNPTFTITSGGRTASGTMGFGASSCIFRVADSTFAPSSPIADGSAVEIDDCGILLDTAGQVADGVAIDILGWLFLNGATSTGTTVTVSISPSGTITVNGIVVGTVTLRPITGAF